MIEWKICSEFPKYSVSNTGLIKNNRTQKLIEGKLDKDGYRTVGIRKDIEGKSVRKHRRVHRLVAQAFIPNPSNYPVVNHIDGIKDNNKADNLEWCTIAYNTKHSFMFLNREGNVTVEIPVCCLDPKTQKEIARFPNMVEASKFVNLSKGAINAYFNRVENGYPDTLCGNLKWKKL